jgi:nucleotide-binding universal stress UspA family protein
MSPEQSGPGADTQPAAAQAVHERIFLVVIDSSAEMRNALRFACRRAQRTGGRVALLYAIEPADFQHWMAVQEKMREERRGEAEQVLQKLASEVQLISGSVPVLYVREGDPRDAIMQVIKEEPRIAILVLGAGTQKKGPGPLVTSLVGKMSGKFPIPITVVPGSLTEEEIDALT